MGNTHTTLPAHMVLTLAEWQDYGGRASLGSLGTLAGYTYAVTGIMGSFVYVGAL